MQYGGRYQKKYMHVTSYSMGEITYLHMGFNDELREKQKMLTFINF